MSFKGILSKYFNPGNRQDSSSDHSTTHDSAKEFMEEEVVKIEDDDVELVLENEEAINKKFSGAKTLSKYAELGKIMMAMLKDMKNRVYPEIPWFTIATVVLALLYVLNPMDLVPDFIPGVGYIDDLSVLAIGTGWIESDLHKYLDWKLKKGEGL
ncbi:YkvA family protein [Aequorivita marina]|uniref:YkvA family protein n=1 Tax=Aequorivita marina TaxID=3073654 RepID=UPI002874447B|nr:YkvA family protein [Aequorivita sp. S2608]MDS1298365.1 YkvA family protein [Aequorivita sp. S2608]